MRVIKKPMAVDAVRLSHATKDEVVMFLGMALRDNHPGGMWRILPEEVSDTCGEEEEFYLALNVRTIHGELAVVRHGDWIFPEMRNGAPVDGRFYPVQSQYFDEHYEFVE